MEKKHKRKEEDATEAKDNKENNDRNSQSRLKKRRMEERNETSTGDSSSSVALKKKSTIVEGISRIDKLKQDNDVMSSLMYEMLCLMHERDTNLFVEADTMIQNALSRMHRLRRNNGRDFVGRWLLHMDAFTEEEANQKGDAFIEINQNFEGSCMYGDLLATLKGEMTEDNKLFRFSWQGSRGVHPCSGVGRLRFADFHTDEDRIEGVFDIQEGEVPEEVAYATFKAVRQLDTLIEEFFGL